MMGLKKQFMCCFSGPKEPLSARFILAAAENLQPQQEECQGHDPIEDLLELQKEISALALGGHARLGAILRTVSSYTGAEASLFGVAEDHVLVLLASSQPDEPDRFAGTKPGARQASILQSAFASQRPAYEEVPARETGSTSTGLCGMGAVCAVPLFGANIAGALVLETGGVRSVQCLLNERLGDISTSNKARARQRLLSTPVLLYQLGLAVSVGLGIDADQLQWLAGALHRVSSCDSMTSLVGELCEDVAAHVKRRYIVETTVRAALLPCSDAPLGLLFHAQPVCSASQMGVTRSVRSNAEYGGGSLALAGSQAGCQEAAQQPCGRGGVLSSIPSRNRLNALAVNSGIGSSDCGATSRLSRRPASTNFPEPSASGRASSLYGDVLGALASRPTDSHLAHAALPSASHTTVVVQLPPHLAVEAPSASLHAQAFPLKHTVLQALASGDAAGAGGGGGGFAGSCIEDVALYLQNVHNPSRDVCVLLAGMRAAPAGQPVSPRTHCGTGTSPLNPLYNIGGGASGWGQAATLQSLVLVGMRLGNSVLAFYLCFSKRLPGELLQAVCDSCNELLREVFAGPVRTKLEGSLSAEFETLRSTTPGHFAVLRSASVNGLMHHSQHQHQRPGSQVNVSTRTSRLFTSPGTSCGAALLTGKTVSACKEAPIAPVAVLDDAGAGTVSMADVAGAEAGNGLGSGADGPKLSRRPNAELSDCSQGEITVFPVSGTMRGAGLPRAVSFSMGHGGGGVGESNNPTTAKNKNGGDDGRCVPTQPPAPSDVVSPSALGNDDLLSMLMAMRQSEAAGCSGCCSPQQGGGGDPRSACIMTVMGVDNAAASTRQQLDLLVTSIHTTMTTEVNGVMLGLSEDLDQLELLDVLGKGGGGLVYKGRLGTQEVAVKVMELPDMDVGNSLTPRGGAFTLTPDHHQQVLHAHDGIAGGVPAAAAHVPNPAAAAVVAKEQLRARRALLRNAMEMAVQGRVSHPNLIQVYATYSNVMVEQRTRPDGSTWHCLVPAEGSVQEFGLSTPPTVYCAIVAELADCGSLAAALRTRVFPRVMLVPRGPGAEQEQQQPFQLDMRGIYMTLLDVALALRHLHSLNLVHRDIKPANLLLKSNPRDLRGFTVKLADFGFVLHLSETAEDGTRYVRVEQACGTVTHMAPELLPGKARVDASADVYSFGILMWELVSGGVRPYPHLNPDHIPRHVYKGARPVFSDTVPLVYRGLAQACWATEPHQRPKAADLVALITTQVQPHE